MSPSYPTHDQILAIANRWGMVDTGQDVRYSEAKEVTLGGDGYVRSVVATKKWERIGPQNQKLKKPTMTSQKRITAGPYSKNKRPPRTLTLLPANLSPRPTITDITTTD